MSKKNNNNPESNQKNNRATRAQLEKKRIVKWIVKITLLALLLSVSFSFLSQLVSQNANVWGAFLLLIFLLFVNIAGDAIAVATTACELSPLLAMASRKEKGAKTAIYLVKNAEKVSSIFADVVGDIAGLLSGTFIIIISIRFFKDGRALTVANLIFSAVVGSLIISGKAIVKVFALKHPQKIVMGFSKFLELFKKAK